jgi:hypothetical protein
MKKLTALIAIIFSIGKVYSQGPIFGYDQGNILYLGYENKVEFGTSDGRPFEIFIEDGKFISDTLVKEERETDSIVYYLMPYYNSKTTKVLFLNPSTKEPFDTIVFNVYNLPDPTLYWGATEEGGKVSRSQNRFFVKYPTEIPLNTSFSIRSWELVIPGIKGTPITGKGNTLDETAMSLLRLAKPGSSIYLNTSVVGPDGVLRKLGSVFILQ